MADIKLFRLNVSGNDIEELQGTSVQLEKSLQILIERNLEKLLGVRFLASEMPTGKMHGGRIDTLGFDENGSPVIIEYKRALNENIINQGLFYLDWLLDHKADFKLLVMERLGVDAAAELDWTAPRLLCIAADFTRYDEHAVRQIGRNIELIRYRRFAGDLLLFELVNATGVTSSPPAGATPARTARSQAKSAADRLADAAPQVRDWCVALKTFLLALGDDVQLKPLHNYFAFRRLKTFATVDVQGEALRVFVKVPPESIVVEQGFSRDVTALGKPPNLEITIGSLEQLERAKPLLLKSYEVS